MKPIFRTVPISTEVKQSDVSIFLDGHVDVRIEVEPAEYESGYMGTYEVEVTSYDGLSASVRNSDGELIDFANPEMYSDEIIYQAEKYIENN